MSSSPTGWWRRGCFSSIGAGLNDEQTNIMSQPQAVYHLRWLKSMRGFQSSGVVTHLSKTSRLRASFVRVGVLSVFWRNSTFFFRLCGHTHTHEGFTTMQFSVTESKSTFGGFALQKSLYQLWPDRSAKTSFPPWSCSPPLRLCETERTLRTFNIESTLSRINSSVMA